MNHDDDFDFYRTAAGIRTEALFTMIDEQDKQREQERKEKIKAEQAAQAEWDASLPAQLIRLVVNLLYIIALVIRAIAYYPVTLITYLVRKVNDVLSYIIDGLEP